MSFHVQRPVLGPGERPQGVCRWPTCSSCSLTTSRRRFGSLVGVGLAGCAVRTCHCGDGWGRCRGGNPCRPLDI